MASASIVRQGYTLWAMIKLFRSKSNDEYHLVENTRYAHVTLQPPHRTDVQNGGDMACEEFLLARHNNASQWERMPKECNSPSVVFQHRWGGRAFQRVTMGKLHA